jgi:D-arabinose 1-dehydrogenase-like Zn-dependent alcohol dehydrogenase
LEIIGHSRKIGTIHFDLAGFQESLDVARQLVWVGDDSKIIGLDMGGATIPVGFFATPYEASVGTTYWGCHEELFEAIELAKVGKLNVHVERFSIDDAPKAYQRLHDGTLYGRAVVGFLTPSDTTHLEMIQWLVPLGIESDLQESESAQSDAH